MNGAEKKRESHQMKRVFLFDKKQKDTNRTAICVFDLH